MRNLIKIYKQETIVAAYQKDLDFFLSNEKEKKHENKHSLKRRN